MERILPGEVAWYVTGRFYAAEDGSLLDAGYFLHLQGIDAGMFGGDPGEGTARFTFLADPFTAAPLSNGGLSLGLDAVGEFAVYLNRRPGATFDDPASFGAGEEVARFRRVAVVTGATLGSGEGTLISLNVFSARLVSSREFELDGRRHDLRRLMPNGVTQWGTAAAGATVDLAGYRSVVPFVGSAIAIGGAEGVGRGLPSSATSPEDLTSVAIRRIVVYVYGVYQVNGVERWRHPRLPHGCRTGSTTS